MHRAKDVDLCGCWHKLSVAVFQVVLGIVMFATTAAYAMPPAMREMIAVQMHRSFVCVSAIACIYIYIIGIE